MYLQSYVLHSIVTLPFGSREQNHTLREGPLTNHPEEKTVESNLQDSPNDPSLLVFTPFMISTCCVWTALSDSILLNSKREKRCSVTRRLSNKRQHDISFLCSLPYSVSCLVMSNNSEPHGKEWRLLAQTQSGQSDSIPPSTSGT